MNKFLLIILIIGFTFFNDRATSQSKTEKLLPIQDVYISNTTEGKTTAYGTTDPENLIARFSIYNFARKAYIQFDLTDYAAEEIEGIQLRLYGGVTDNAGNANDLYTMIFPLPHDEWDEATLSWDTRASEGTPEALDSAKIIAGEAKYHEWNNLTEYIKAQLSEGNSIISFRIQNKISTPSPEPFVTFNSKEAATNKPELLITLPTSDPDPGEPIELHPDKVQVVEEDGKHVLYRGMEPYFIKGAGGQIYLDKMVEHGANSFRLWSTNEVQEESSKSPMELLDDAHELGLTVTMGLWVMHPRHSASFYDNPERVAQQLEDFRNDVLKYKDHPALLMWAVGNEVHLETSDTKVWDAVEDIIQMIHEEDPNHPASTVTADLNQDLVNTLKEKVPSLDVLGINSYGNGQVNMPDKVRDLGWTKAYYMGESGPTNHWQVNGTSWGAKYEPLNYKKAETYLNAYNAFKADEEMCIGTYVFKWGWKWQRTYSWINIFTSDGLHGEVADILHYAWKGAWPTNRSPETEYVLLNERSPSGSGITLDAETIFVASVEATDPDGDPLTYEWRLYPEGTSNASGGDAETAPSPVEGAVVENNGETATIKTPAEGGGYRLYTFVYDGNGHVSISNHPFFVAPKEFESTGDSLFAVEDTYVRGGAYATDNYGAQPVLISKTVENPSFARETYVKFDISSLSNPADNVLFNLHGLVADGVEVEVFAVDDNEWGESSMTWDTKPSTAEKVAALEISDNSEGIFSWNVTAYFNSAIEAGRNHLSLMVQAKTETEREIKWNSKEAGTKPPSLSLEIPITTGLRDKGVSNFEIFPNPVEDVLNLRMHSSDKVLNIKVYNIEGETVMHSVERATGGLIHLDTSDLPYGLYSLQVNGSKALSKRFMKVK